MLPPPPPPLRPSRALQRTKVVNSISSSHSGLFDAVVKRDFDSENLRLEQHDKIERSFKPCHMFFYGSLMDTEVIQAILNLPEIPSTSSATLHGYKVKMWGIYPALVPSDFGQVVGCVWKVSEEDHFHRLAAYETDAYTWVDCEAQLENGMVHKDCRTFCWAGSPDSKELEDGVFDLKRYQKYFKSSVVRSK